MALSAGPAQAEATYHPRANLAETLASADVDAPQSQEPVSQPQPAAEEPLSRPRALQPEEPAEGPVRIHCLSRLLPRKSLSRKVIFQVCCPAPPSPPPRKNSASTCQGDGPMSMRCPFVHCPPHQHVSTAVFWLVEKTGC